MNSKIKKILIAIFSVGLIFLILYGFGFIDLKSHVSTTEVTTVLKKDSSNDEHWIIISSFDDVEEEYEDIQIFVSDRSTWNSIKVGEVKYTITFYTDNNKSRLQTIRTYD